jgi:4-diphosphocytidyl-2-C-methyl-D-erythritol kinase
MQAMPEFSCWPAPAKLNLFLRITGRRRDGYHELQTCYQLLDWGDEIEFAVTDDSRVVRESGLAGVAPEDDLVVRAARLLQRHVAGAWGVRIRVHKQIPAGAGLGGGSSDAATTLLALNHLWSGGLAPGELAALGAELGADVPVFVRGCSAWAEGIGDILYPMELGERHYVLVFPGIHIPTAELFAAPELERNADPVERAHFDLDDGGNVFEPVARARYPRLDEIMLHLGEFGIPRMTGTGSCIFLPVKDKLCAESVTRRLECRYNVRSVAGLDRSPVLTKGTGGN